MEKPTNRMEAAKDLAIALYRRAQGSTLMFIFQNDQSAEWKKFKSEILARRKMNDPKILSSWNALIKRAH